jgi:hypothetical protein
MVISSAKSCVFGASGALPSVVSLLDSIAVLAEGTASADALGLEDKACSATLAESAASARFAGVTTSDIANNDAVIPQLTFYGVADNKT